MQAVAGPSGPKRQRSENWLDVDKIILTELVKERVHVLENKNTDSNTNSKKVAAWNDLRTSFQNMAHTPRTLAQLKAQWSLIKMGAKKKKTFERRERLRTGGGPQPDTEPASGEDIAVWLPNEFTIDTNEFDSDKVNIGIYNSKDQKDPEQKGEEKTVTADELQEVIIIEECENQVIEADIPQPPPPPVNDSPASVRKQMKRGFQKKKCSKRDGGIDTPAQKIAAVEIACREELHEAQMANEKQKFINLTLKEEVLQAKLNYYKNKP